VGNTIQDSNSNIQLCVQGGTSGGSAPTWKTVAGQYTVDGSGGLVWECMGAAASTITVANNATFQQDFGVQYASNGQQLQKVSSPSAAGQYSVSGGVYSFYTTGGGDAGVAMLISYSYAASARGATATLTNQLMGYAPNFQAFLYNVFNGKFFGLQLNSCQASEISIPTKQEDFWIVDFNFDASCDATNTLGKLYADLA
jgi:hypothetical protein